MYTMKVMLSVALLAACAIYVVSAGKDIPCCTRVSRRKPSSAIQIERFYIQKADPPCVEAVMFMTNTSVILCSHPNTPWVKKEQVELRKKEEEFKRTRQNMI